MRCRIEKREGYDTKFEEKHEILHTHTNSKQKRVFQERGREEEKRFSIVTGHSHAQAQPKRKIQTKQNSAFLCVLAQLNKSRPVIFNLHTGL